MYDLLITESGDDTYLIFVTTITTAGCVKNLAKCKNFQMEHEKLLYTQCEILHTVLSQIYELPSVKFLGLKLQLCQKIRNIRYGKMNIVQLQK